MKQTKTVETLPASALRKDGVYFDSKGSIIKIKSIDKEKSEMNIFNISEQYHSYFVKFERHNLVKVIR